MKLFQNLLANSFQDGTVEIIFYVILIGNILAKDISIFRIKLSKTLKMCGHSGLKVIKYRKRDNLST